MNTIDFEDGMNQLNQFDEAPFNGELVCCKTIRRTYNLNNELI